MSAGVDNLSGFAIVVANIRAAILGYTSIQEQLCTCFCEAFQQDQSIGQTIYQQINSNVGLLQTVGLDQNSTYNSIEQIIIEILSTAYPSQSIENIQILALTANALIFAYYTYSDLDIDTVLSILAHTLQNVASNITNSQIFFTDVNGFIATPFTEDIISNLFNYDYQSVLTALTTSPKTSTVEMVNYNWFEAQDAFTTPNLQLMKDVENQYYYISGQLIYNSVNQELPACIETPITVQTLTGVIQSSYIQNLPCIDVNSYIGPITGTTFYRIFNDGPDTIGDFTSSTEQQYIAFDEAYLTPTQYGSNNEILYSFLTGSNSGYLPLCNDGVFIDAVGQYNLNAEYLNAPQPYNCTDTYQSMHIGGIQNRTVCDVDISGNCYNCQSGTVTGFKFVTLELDSGIWFDDFAYLNTNPYTEPGNVLKRALNIETYSYVSQLNDDYFNTINSDGQQYFSFPQLTGKNSLPTIAFAETFDSPSFGKKASVVLFPSIGTSNNGNGSQSDRQYVISNNPIFSGLSTNSIIIGESGTVSVVFGAIVSSQFPTDDGIAKQFFGMGDSFGNQFTVLGAEAYNAGYLYSGYVISGSGVVSDLIDYNNQLTETVLGSPVDNIQFVSGYVDNFNNLYEPTQMFAQDSSGNLVKYFYYDNRNLSFSQQVQENQWSYFSPLPESFENEGGFQRVISKQQVENYLPRYASGAYSNQTKKILYPNAITANNIYNSTNNGFPTNVQFVLNIREEAVRELYARFYINTDGTVSNIPSFTRVIRPSSNNTIDFTIDAPTMRNIFIPDNTYYDYEYDFNNFDINETITNAASLNMVDNNYSPEVNSYSPSGKNSSIYGNIQSPFNQGIRMTGNGTLINKIFYGTGMSDFTFINSPLPITNGIFHYYRGLQITGYLSYTLPIFDLETGTIFVNKSIQNSFPLMINGNYNTSDCVPGIINCQPVGGGIYHDINGNTGIIKSGFDPIFLEYMGGRSGGYLIQEEGGYHSKGIIGDMWNNFSYSSYGMGGNPWECGGEIPCYNCATPTRVPTNDADIVIVSSTPTQTNIYTRALMYNPFVLTNVPFVPFLESEIYSYSIDGNIGNLELDFTGDFASFSLNEYFPNVYISSGGFSSQNGLIIGPFDREMELGVLSGNQIYCNGNLYINGNQLTDPSGLGGCDINAAFYGYGSLDSGIIPGENQRNSLYTIFAVIPQGQTAVFNISGYPSGTCGFSGFNSIVSLRPRKITNATFYDPDYHIGEFDWVNSFNFLNNGIEQSFQISTNTFEDLQSDNFNFITYSNSGLLYPVPAQDFTGLGTFDKFGNLIYPPTATVESYWKAYAKKNNQVVVISGWREGSRISFTFEQIEENYNVIPYQNHVLITPSGSCTVTGAMGYYSQADASIFSAGVYLTDATAPIPNNINEYQPYFFSTVLNRIPYALQPPTGIINRPVLEAPSVMIQRKFVPQISGNQSYNKLLNYPPDNYNKLCWAALSDLETLNPGETIEETPPDDTITFTNSTILFSASQGQPLPNGKNNPFINKTYDVTVAYQTYDSIATDAVINSGKCITTERGTQVRIDQSMLSGVLIPLGTTISMVKDGFS